MSHSSPSSISSPISNPIPVRALLFDLDGTLLDTAQDLVLALNNLLKAHGRAPIPYEVARFSVSQGSVALTRLGFPEVIDETEFEALRQEFLITYKACLCEATEFYPGMPALLDALDAQSIPWGIVTNKPGNLTDPLVARLNLHTRSQCVISGDTLSVRKPHPEPLLLASDMINMPPRDVLYIGDDPRDITAGNAAGMYTCVANYGYIEADLDTSLWGADFCIDQPLEVLQHIALTQA